MLKNIFTQNLAVGLLASALTASCTDHEANKNSAYCYDDMGIAILSGPLGDGFYYISYYNPLRPGSNDRSKLTGYKKTKTDLAANNAEVEKLCAIIKEGKPITLPAPEYPMYKVP